MIKYLEKTIILSLVFCGLFLLYLSSLYNYLLFHSLVEIVSIIIAVTVFLITWNSSKYLNNNYLIVIGTAYLFVGSLDLFHTLAYKGMQIFKDYDYYANQLWIAARYFESIVLLISFSFLRMNRKINRYIIFGVFSIITILILFSVFIWKIFPICFVEGVGLTPFKIISEYVISGILILSIIVLRKTKESFDKKIYRYVLISIILTIISEIAFTFYVDNYGISNLVGHYFKLFSFYLIYKAIIVTGIQEPYNIIFREIKETEGKLYNQNILLKNLTMLDSLTGLFNHRYLYEKLEDEAHRSQRYLSNFCILMIDIDNFKIANDDMGHIYGDNILKELAEIFKSNLRDTDIAGRYGGDEFFIILVETDIKVAYLVAEKLRKAVEVYNFEQDIKITISIGVQEYANEPISEFVEKADKKLYSAKNNGRNRTVS
jgi:diguanylate cyclase (GGDEF)-like protein